MIRPLLSNCVFCMKDCLEKQDTNRISFLANARIALWVAASIFAPRISHQGFDNYKSFGKVRKVLTFLTQSEGSSSSKIVALLLVTSKIPICLAFFPPMM